MIYLDKVKFINVYFGQLINKKGVSKFIIN